MKTFDKVNHKASLDLTIKNKEEEVNVLRIQRKKLKADRRNEANELAINKIRNKHIHEVRPVLRSLNIAKGMLKGKEYKQIERQCHVFNQPNWKQVMRLMEEYGLRDNNNKENSIVPNWWYAKCLSQEREQREINRISEIATSKLDTQCIDCENEFHIDLTSKGYKKCPNCKSFALKSVYV